MKRIFLAASMTVMAVIFAYAGSARAETDSRITSVVYENVRAVEKENFEALLATMYKESPLYGNTVKTTPQMKELFNMYDLKYELKDVRVLEKSDREAKVQYIQITRKAKGPAFRNNKLTGIYFLRKTEGKWKLYDSEIKKIEYLN